VIGEVGGYAVFVVKLVNQNNSTQGH
jgi:hypothetical protein